MWTYITQNVICQSLQNLLKVHSGNSKKHWSYKARIRDLQIAIRGLTLSFCELI